MATNLMNNQAAEAQDIKQVIYDDLNACDVFTEDMFDDFIADAIADDDCVADGQGYWEWLYDQLDMWESDERSNLDIDAGCGLIAVGSLGLWNGTPGCVLCLKSSNIGEALFEVPGHFRCDSRIEIYGQGGDVHVDVHHHDGVNRLVVRKCDKGEDPGEILDIIRSGGLKPGVVAESKTSSIFPAVAGVYGW